MTRSLVLAAVAFVAAAGCTAPAEGELLVSAAASLTDALGDLEQAFEAANPDVDLVANLAGSATLRTQIEDGAPVDAFLSADRATADALVSAGLTEGEPVRFATNGLQLTVPAGNPGGVRSLADLADASLAVGLCEEHVPCGALADRVLAEAGVEAAVDTREPDVRSLLSKLAAGELDAGLVYRTDVLASELADGDAAVEAVGPPTVGGVTTEYVAVRVADATNPVAAEAFLSFLTSDDARLILATHGFRSR